jgi:hypothetical protein
MGVLAVEVDEVRRHLGKRRGGSRASVDVRTRPPVGRDHTAEHGLVVIRHEAGVDARLSGAWADDRGIGTPTDDEIERLNEHRLAGARLTGDRRQSLADNEIDGADDAEVLDVQLAEHRPILHGAVTDEWRLESPASSSR